MSNAFESALGRTTIELDRVGNVVGCEDIVKDDQVLQRLVLRSINNSIIKW